MTTLKVNGVTLGVEHFGDAAAPLTLLAGGPTMLSWPDPLCEALARGGRHVVRYDLRDSGTSTTVDPEASAYTLRDLAADAAALARELDDRLAHLAGISVGGMVAQIAALDYPDAFSALTLVGTRPVAPGRVDDDLPEHDGRRWSGYSRARCPTGPTELPWQNSPPPARRFSATTPSLHARPPRASGTAHPAPLHRSRWPTSSAWSSPSSTANRAGASVLPEIEIPTLVVHAGRDPFFPVANGEAIAREIPGAQLLILEEAATAIPDAAADEVAKAMVTLG
jgi:pimeloyl-ACP methyl ester carboxylesterase